MTTTEKIWSAKVAMQYPKQWIVMVEMECDPKTNKYMGIVHYVTNDKKEAYEKSRELGKSMGKKVVIEGFNDTPQIGGFPIVEVLRTQTHETAKSALFNIPIELLTLKVLSAAKNILGDKLEKVILYGSYARGDFDSESDIDFFILANIPQEETGKWRGNIRKSLPLIDLEHDITVSLKVASSSVFHQYAETLPYYMNILREGVQLND